MNVLVTGGAGFIGSHLVEKLISNGDHVICVDNLSLGSKDNIHSMLSHPNFSFHQFDLVDTIPLDDLFKSNNIDIVYHLAANSDIQLGFNDISTDFESTLLSTFNVLSCMKKYSVKRIVFASSSAVYGVHEEHIHENSGPLHPISNYGAAKLASEAYISSFSHGYGIQAWIIRFPNVIGWRLTHGVIYDFLNKLTKNSSELLILGNGKQEKPYLFVTDLLNAIELSLRGSLDRLNVFNVAPDTLSSVDFIANEVIKGLCLNDVHLKYTGGKKGWVGDVPKFQYNTKKIKNLGWRPSYTSDDAVIQSIEEEIKSRK